MTTELNELTTAANQYGNKSTISYDEFVAWFAGYTTHLDLNALTIDCLNVIFVQMSKVEQNTNTSYSPLFRDNIAPYIGDVLPPINPWDSSKRYPKPLEVWYGTGVNLNQAIPTHTNSNGESV